MHCPACQRENRSEARFCAGCGTSLVLRCGGCDRELPPDAGFCDACGLAVAGTEPPTASSQEPADPRAYTPAHLAKRILTHRSALEGERKHVTVLFADLAGFTPLSEGRDPEEMHALMDGFFERLLAEVHRYEGTVNQFLGDGAMALFGAPIALEDAPRRAVVAALGIQRQVSAFAEERGLSLPLRIGIHSGPVVVGRIGDDLRMDYTAVGDTTNLAARLQQQAAPGEVLISEATTRLIEGYFDLEDQGEKSLRGFTAPLRVFRVVAERPVSGRIDVLAEAGLTRLLGRDRELASLREAFENARAGRGQAAFLVGDAGIGKSRLLYEFRLGLEAEPHVWFEGRCASYGSTSAFHSIIDGLKRRFGIEDRDDDASAVGKLEAGISLVDPELVWTLPFLRKLLSLAAGTPEVEALDPITRRSETIRALQALFLGMAAQRTLVFAVEDLHWIDTASEEFLELLIDSIPAARVCVLMSHRPGYQHPFGDRSYHVRIALRNLSDGEMAEMAGSILEVADLPEALRELVAKKAEGNPFFIEEVTKSLIEEGVLRIEEGLAVLTRKISEITIPDSIQGVLMARIDRLDEEPKRAIQIASVIGREFALRLLERIVEAGEAMGAVVGELRSLELIYQKAAHPELAFMFKHALTHDVAYGSVLQKRRKVLHAVVGNLIEELYAERLAEHYVALAHHFTEAEEWDRALLYHERAAEKARDAYANHSAVKHFQRALDVADEIGSSVAPEQRQRLAEGLGDAHYCLSELRESGDAYCRAADATDRADVRAMNLGRAADAYLWSHHYDLSDPAMHRAVTSSKEAGCDAALAMALVTQAQRAATRRGLAAFEHPERAGSDLIALARGSGDDEALARSLTVEGLWAEHYGDYSRALEASRAAYACAARTRRPHLTIMPRWIVGLSLCCLGRYGEALSAFGEAEETATRVGDRALRSRLLNTLGWAYGEIGCYERASEFNRKAEVLAQEMLDLGLVASIPEIRSNAAINLASDLTSLGDWDSAGLMLERIWQELVTPGDPWQRWRYGLNACDALARLALARRDTQTALAFVDGELAGARAQASRKLEARALELRARILLFEDRREESAESASAALELGRRIEYPPVVWRSLAVSAEIARRAGELRAAERTGREARDLIEGLAAGLPEKALRASFQRFGARLVEDPLGDLS